MALRKWELAIADALRMARSIGGVTGVDFGYVYKDGVRLATRGIRFHVPGKLPLSDLPPGNVIPKKNGSVRCDVIEARYSLNGNPKGPCDPIQAGVSVGNLTRLKTGTLGMVVNDTIHWKPAVLSNWHVLCGTPSAKAGDEITQPGPHHNGTMVPRVIGALERWVPLDAGCDAAIALLSPGVVATNTLFDQTAAINGVENPRVGLKVIKYGTMSRLTHGVIDGISGSYEVDYSDYDDERRWIDGVRIVLDPDVPDQEISLAGDSGAVWLNAANSKAVALHFAGEDGLGPTAEYALAQPLPRVFDLLSLAIA